MKTKVLFILVVLITSSVFAQRGVRIAYIDMEYILENVDEYQEANNQLNAKAEKWKNEIEGKRGTIEQMRKNLSAEKILLTDELVKERQEEIQLLEKEMIDYQQDRFGPQGDLMIQRNQLAKPVQDQVFNAVQDIVKSRKYDFVFDKSADMVMLYSNKRHDISDLILRSINRTRKQNEAKTKSNKRKNGEKAKEAEEKAPNPVAEAKKEAAAEKQEEKNSIIEDKKQQKIDEREARKKAYEERKKKILADKEAKRKAKLEERQKKKDENKKTDTNTKENGDN